MPYLDSRLRGNDRGIEVGNPGWRRGFHFSSMGSMVSAMSEAAVVPPRRVKFAFWIILGATATVLAEVVTASTPFPLFTLTGLLIIVPVYLAHIVVLATIIWRWGRPTLTTLFLGGMLFGLYEAYITKVLWTGYADSPGYGSPPYVVGGVAVAEFLFLVFFWHAVMAFILPLALTEPALTSSRAVAGGMPARLRGFLGRHGWWILAALAVFFGIFESNSIPSAEHALLAGVGNTAALALVIYLWRGLAGTKRYRLEDLLPRRRGFIVWCIILALTYGFGFLIHPEGLPGIRAQVTIWIVYAILIFLFVIHLRRSRATISPERNPGEILGNRPFWRGFLGAALLFAWSSFLAKQFLAPGAAAPFALILFFVGSGLGVLMFLRILWRTLRRR